MRKCIAIDGPSGTGKSTIAKILSQKLEMVYVDTGAMYRAIGYRLNALGFNLDDEDVVCENMNSVNLEIKYIDGAQNIFVDGENVTSTIRTQEVSTFASKIAVYKDVRSKLVKMQQDLAEQNDVIMDGRDIGTKVLPNAKYKFYLDANPEERTKRRINELTLKGIECDYNTILMEIIERDDRDKNRAESPLVQAEDAVLIDTSNLNIDEVVNSILSHIK